MSIARTQAAADHHAPPAVCETSVACRWCNAPAEFVDRYRVPFAEDRAVFSDGMGIYYCRNEGIGFAYPVPTSDALREYYGIIYRDRRRWCSEDPHQYYTVVTETPLAESQFMYLSQFVNFDAIRTVIDMGCGYGILLRRIHEEQPDIRLVGVELDPAVRPFLNAIGAETIHASAGDSVEAIDARIGNGTLLISSHTLHYQRDHAFLREIIHRTRQRRVRDVHCFIEVPNDPVHDPTYVRSRIYDVPKLIFFTPDAFQRGVFGLETVHVTTTGWTIDQELVYRARRVEAYERSGNHAVLQELVRFGKSAIPPCARRAMRAALTGTGAADAALPYFSYGGSRRAVRMIGKVA